jgi:hypothetical protein
VTGDPELTVNAEAVKLAIAGEAPVGAVAESQPGNSGFIWTTSKFSEPTFFRFDKSSSSQRGSEAP